MDWKKSDYSKAQLEAQQRAYIKEALEMAKRSVVSAAEPTPAAEPVDETVEEKSLAAEEPSVAEETSADAEEAVAEEQAAEEATKEIAEESEETMAEADFIQKEELTRFIPEKEEKETLAPQPLKTEKEAPLNLNQYINNHNRNQCSCRACQGKRTGK